VNPGIGCANGAPPPDAVTAASHRLSTETMLRTYCASARCTRSCVTDASPNASVKSRA
jgi:hypothetical protein